MKALAVPFVHPKNPSLLPLFTKLKEKLV